MTAFLKTSFFSWFFQVDPKLKKAVRPKAQKPVSEANPWGYRNNGGKKFTSQSKRDPNYEQHEKEERKLARTEVLLKQVKSNALLF